MTKEQIFNLKREREIIEYFRGRLGAINLLEDSDDDLNSFDAVLFKDGKLMCVEVKNRKYDLKFFKKYGVAVEDHKLQRAKIEWGLDKLILLTITSDNHLLVAEVTDNTSVEFKVAANQTDGELYGISYTKPKKMRVKKMFKIIDLGDKEIQNI